VLEAGEIGQRLYGFRYIVPKPMKKEMKEEALMNTNFDLDMPMRETQSQDRDLQMDDSVDFTSENDAISWWQDEK
jgi:hypothetical protein